MNAIPIQQVIATIDASPATAFKIEFAKKDGTLRQMIMVKRNRTKSANKKTAHAKSKFKVSLSDNYLLLVNELIDYQTKTNQVPGLGTVHELVDQDVVVGKIKVDKHPQQSKNISILSIRRFNDKMVYA
jgi:hypothetical protein